MSLYIIKINKNKNIYISKNLSLLENYENKKEIFKASLLVNYFNAIDKESQYFSVYEEDLVEKINKKLNTSKKKLKLKDILPHGKPFLLFKYEEKNVKMHLKRSIEEYNLDFKIFDIKDRYRVVKKRRFENESIKSKWVNKETALKIQNIINKNNNYGLNGRNIEVCLLENFEKRMNYIYRMKNRNDSYYILKEIEVDNKIEEILTKRIKEKSKIKDQKISFHKIKNEFLSHIFKNIKIKANFQALHKEKWGERVLLMETKIKEFDKNLFSVREQKMLLNRIFPSMIYDEKSKTFKNEQRLKNNVSSFLIKNYKFNILMSIIKKAKDIGIKAKNIHYKLLEEALSNHQLREIEKNKTQEDLLKFNKKYKQPLNKKKQKRAA
tara:strand:+ start:9044 stop:10186 length:1143 start_codon:yes stop_codon:yes gene_type:complete